MMISDDDLADPANPIGGPDGAAKLQNNLNYFDDLKKLIVIFYNCYYSLHLLKYLLGF